jgi:hypothetical protein
VAYAGRHRSLSRAVYVTNVDTGETKLVTDGLDDLIRERDMTPGSKLEVS